MKLILLVGNARSGKDTIVQRLQTQYGLKNVYAIASPLKELVNKYTELSEATKDEVTKKSRKTYRDQLISVGKTFIETFHRNIWIQIICDQIKKDAKTTKHFVGVVSDVRHENELQYILNTFPNDYIQVWKVENYVLGKEELKNIFYYLGNNFISQTIARIFVAFLKNPKLKLYCADSEIFPLTIDRHKVDRVIINNYDVSTREAVIESLRKLDHQIAKALSFMGL
jgi:hypothetical protein